MVNTLSQLRRIPTPVALAVGVFFGVLFARVLPWSTVCFSLSLSLSLYSRFVDIFSFLEKWPSSCEISPAESSAYPDTHYRAAPSRS